VPLLTDDGLLGVLHVGSVEVRRFRADEVDLLQMAAERIAAAIERALRRDVEREAREAAEAANRAKDEFLALLSHELRNPLAAMMNAVVIARLDEGQRDRALDIARRQTQHLSRLVDDLLDVARITQGRISLCREPLLLRSVIGRQGSTWMEDHQRRSRCPADGRAHGRRRPGAARTDRDEPPDQRREVHESGRAYRDPARARRRPGRAVGAR
jgi:signal transduction histidine kinase